MVPQSLRSSHGIFIVGVMVYSVVMRAVSRITGIIKGLLGFDLHREDHQRLLSVVVLVILCCLAVFVRKSLIHFQDEDYTIFASWYDFLKVHGIQSFRYGFSNYNPPYTYFLYLMTLLPIPKIVGIKGLLILFDGVLALSIYYALRVVRPRTTVPVVGAIMSMFLPIVLFTGVLWGQFDQLYVAFVLFSFYACLRGKGKWAWIFFGVALSIKLQAIFFLPLLGVAMFKFIRWQDAVWGLASFMAVTLPPLLVGRSFWSLLNIYPTQMKLFNGQLALNAPSMYQVFPNSTFPYLNNAGIILAMAAMLFILGFAIRYKRFSKKYMLIALALVLNLGPYLLPAMHERYFFPAGVAGFMLAIAYPKPRFIYTAVASQVIILLSYCPFLFGTTPIPFSLLSLAELAVIIVLLAEYCSSTKAIEESAEPVRHEF